MQQNNSSVSLRAILVLTLVIILGFVSFEVWKTLQFHVVSVEPATNNFATVSPYFKVNFNRQLSSSNLRVSSTPDIVGSAQVNGKTLTVAITSTLDQNTSYTITINSIADVKGGKLANLRFTFQPKNVGFDKLPEDQQQTILKQQANKPYTANSITYIGIDALVNDGLSTNQVADLKQALFQYSQSNGIRFAQATVPSSSIQPVAHDPTSTSMTDTINFTLQLDATQYTARINYDGLNSLELILNNQQTGAQVFDSGMLNVAQD